MSTSTNGPVFAPITPSAIEPMVVVAQRSWWASAYHAVSLIGIGAICALVFMFFKPELADQVKAMSPFAEDSTASADTPELTNLIAGSASAPASQEIGKPAPAAFAAPFARSAAEPAPKMMPLLLAAQPSATADAREQERVTKWLAKRYRVASDATHMLVAAAYSTAHDIKLDPLLILSVMAIESRFNPFAESPVGAQGLMQVMSKIHREKFEKLGGVKAALNPLANIRVGSLILKEYVRRGGSVEAGLKMYVGAANLDTDFGYGAKVLGEYRRLKQVANGGKVSVYSTTARAAAPKPAAAPETTQPVVEAEAAKSETADLPA